MRFRAAVIGLGRIGSGAARGAAGAGDAAEPPRTHVDALLQSTDFELAAAADPDAGARDRFARARGHEVPVYPDADTLFAAGHVDLAVISSPTATHLAECERAIQAGVRAIFCEKPFGTDLAHARRVARQAADRGITLRVNYHRRWDAKMRALAEVLCALGTPRFVDVVYRKGLYNYGSHIIDLLLWYFGPVARVRADPAPRDADPDSDPSLSATLWLESGAEVRLSGMDGVPYDLFDVDVYGRAAKVRIEAGGYLIRRFDVADDVYFPGYAHLVERPSGFDIGPVHGLAAAYAELAALLREDAPAAARTPADALPALQVLAVLEAVRESARRGGAMVVP